MKIKVVHLFDSENAAVTGDVLDLGELPEESIDAGKHLHRCGKGRIVRIWSLPNGHQGVRCLEHKMKINETLEVTE